LLLFAECGDEFVGVTMESDLMASINDLADLLGERFCGMCWCEPGCFDVVFVPELEEAIDADCCAKNTTGNVGGVSRCSGLRVQPWDLLGNWIGAFV
jgi:hypothetical protein